MFLFKFFSKSFENMSIVFGHTSKISAKITAFEGLRWMVFGYTYMISAKIIAFENSKVCEKEISHFCRNEEKIHFRFNSTLVNLLRSTNVQ
jgi:hypothetical protein